MADLPHEWLAAGPRRRRRGAARPSPEMMVAPGARRISREKTTSSSSPQMTRRPSTADVVGVAVERNAEIGVSSATVAIAAHVFRPVGSDDGWEAPSGSLESSMPAARAQDRAGARARRCRSRSRRRRAALRSGRTVLGSPWCGGSGRLPAPLPRSACPRSIIRAALESRRRDRGPKRPRS